MVGFSDIPVEMRAELVAGVEYIKTLANRFHKLDPAMVEAFGQKLAEILCHKYTGHWYLDKPMKGQAYRCIRLNRHNREESILEACDQCGFKYEDLTFPKEMTLWIDPYEVSCRLGEEKYPYTVTKFDPREVRLLPDVSKTSEEQEQVSSSVKCFTPTPEDSFSCSSSVSSSPNVIGEDSDSGIDGSSEETYTPYKSYRPTKERRRRPSAVDAMHWTSSALFRTPTPLWIPAWRTAQLCDTSVETEQLLWW